MSVTISCVLDAPPGKRDAFESVEVTVRYIPSYYESPAGKIVLHGSCLSTPPFSSPTGSWIVEHASYDGKWTRAAGPLAASTSTPDGISASCLSPLPSSPGKLVRVRAILLDDPKTSQLAQPSCQSFTINDVAFVFPHEEGPDAVLWGNKQLLKEASPYWARVFDGGFLESHSKLELLSQWQEHARADLLEALRNGALSSSRSSIEEAPARKRPKIEESEEPDNPAPAADAVLPKLEVSSDIGYLVIKETPLATYKTVLTWLERRIPAFGSLPSTTETEEPTAPDAVYALAHYLELEQLQKVAVTNFASQLTATNALAHLLGPRACKYPELRKVAMAAAVKHIKSIKEGKGPDMIEERIIAEMDADVRRHLSGVVKELFRA